MKTPILIVDDEPSMLRSVERVLAPDYEVVTASTAAEALELAAQRAPELAILDIRMPETDGFELLDRLREIRPDLSVIFMTGFVHELDAQLIRAIRQRAFYFISKPFDREVLITIVGRCLELRRLEAENRRYVAQLESELEEARDFQEALLPPATATLGFVEVAAIWEPCTKLGGDFYDYVQASDGRLTVIVADVSGHGVSAAMLTTIVKSGLHAAHAEDYQPLSVVRRISDGLRSFDDDRFVTLFCARVSPYGAVDYVNAGHPAGIILRGGDDVRRLVLTGPLVSPAFERDLWQQERFELAPGDRLVLYTDGLTEARGEAGLFGADRLVTALHRAGDTDGQRLLEELSGALAVFTGGLPADDDRTLLTLRLV